MTSISLENASFRDRSNRVFYCGDAVYRGLRGDALDDWKALVATRFFPEMMAEGRIARTEQVSKPEGLPETLASEYDEFLKHERIPFVSYPYEWCFGMLKDAALLHLDSMLSALEEGMILKDSSPFNVQWRGVQPVFIDIPSFERYQNGAAWIGYRQFCQMFLYPLFLQAHKDIPFHAWFRGDIEGLPPSEFVKLLSFRDLFRRGALTHGYLHAKVESKYAHTSRDVRNDLRSAGFHVELIKANVRNLRSLINKLSWKRHESTWANYAKDNSYTDEDSRAKHQFTRDVFASGKWDLVWDLGCNTGDFSRIAAAGGSMVVAVDSDHLSIERLYQTLKSEGSTTILPLVGNLANPSPALGWRCKERKTLPERGTPGLVLALALIHHIVITANIPMSEFVDWLAQLGADLVIEFVSKEDVMVKTLLRNRLDQYADYELDTFEQVLRRRFEIEKRTALQSGTRTLFFARNRREES